MKNPPTKLVMLRRRLVPCYPYAGWAYGPSSMQEPRRGLKTLDVREYRPLGTPIEFRFYQRYANHPNRQSGVQFLTHYDTHQRFRVKKDFIDYLHWGQEQGQARLPHRHQRVAHDFHEQLHPTLVHQRPRFAGQDPTMAPHADISTSFDPNKRVFSDPEHWNKMFSHRRPGEGDIRLNATDSMSLLGPLVTQTDVQEARFHRETRGPTHGRVPGINAEFRGEFDHQMMQAMSRPLNRTHTLTGNDGRFSNTIYINDPNRHQVLSSSLAKDLQTCIDRATNGVYSKLTVVEAAQSGCTDYFCGGVDMAQLGHDISMANLLRERAAAKLASSSTTAQDAPKSVEKDVAVLLRDANRHIDRADEMLREHAALIYRTYTAARPLMTLVNGKCRGSGCGLALASKFPALKDSSEFIFDGPNTGVTPFGGLTRLLARPETSLKMPGVAEFVMLTGASLFAGDALRLGWTDLYTSLEDVSYHIKDWFNQSEHMHNDAVAWQLGHLLDSAFRMKEAHSSAVERTAITPLRARWIEDIFADQSSVEDIMASLSEVEKLPLTDAHNQCEELHYATTPFTISSVAEAVAKLDASQLRYTLSPWDRSAPVEEVAVRQAADIFTSYVLQRHGDVQVVVHGDEAKLRRWQAQREEEYHRYTEMRAAPHARHVYVKMEGCEGRLIHFDFVFEPSRSGEDQALPELKRRVLAALNMPATREVELGWYLPTLDTCPIQSDRDVAEMLHADPSIEDPRAELKYPPIYLIVKRQSLYFSEWAYAVKHQLLLQSPYALKASLGLLHEVRGDGSAEQIPSLSDSLEMEFRYLVRSMKRPDFYAVGQHTNHSPEEWNAIKEDRERNIHLSHLPTRPLPDYDAVFERNVVLDGHSFALRPRWSPRTLAEVPSDEVAKLRTPITYDDDHTAALDTSIYCSKSERLDGMLEDAGGVEVVAGLGETTEDGKPRVEPWTSNAVVPNNVNFYDMARHPFEDSASSWRRDGFTEGSKAFYEQQYRAAEKAVYDEEGRGIHSYYPTTSAADGTGAGEESNAMLEERLMREVKRAESGVENWARDLRTKAMQGKLDDRVTIATQQEKIYDDEYYRWFIQPGHHPNPSGLRMGKRQTSKKASEEEADLNAFLKNLMDGAASEKRMTEELHEAEELVSAAAVEEMTEDTH